MSFHEMWGEVLSSDACTYVRWMMGINPALASEPAPQTHRFVYFGGLRSLAADA